MDARVGIPTLLVAFSLTSAYSLPPEIWELVFCAFFHEMRRGSRQFARARGLLSLVSSSWRILINSIPWMWRTLDVVHDTSRTVISAFVLRSTDRPIDIVFSHTSSPFHAVRDDEALVLASSARQLAGASDRWSSVSIRSSYVPTIRNLLSVFQFVSAPSLESISFHNTTRYTYWLGDLSFTSPFVVFPHGCPLLHTLDLCGVAIDWSSLAPLPALQTLSIRDIPECSWPTQNAVLHVIRSSPVLRVLVLRAMGCVGVHEPSTPPVSVDCLAVLDLSFEWSTTQQPSSLRNLLLRLRFPVLQQVTVYFYDSEGASDFSAAGLLFVCHALHLRGAVSRLASLQLMGCFSGVSSLHLGSQGGFILSLGEQLPGSSLPFSPGLAVLRVHPGNWDVLDKCIKGRMALGVAPIRRVECQYLASRMQHIIGNERRVYDFICSNVGSFVWLPYSPPTIVTYVR
ncbi:hypothetical protein B0H11DRAFT_2254766 [Mycena galericulata]|nr:hypothetical protein B0H11DRAFT_2254766 [Mycena galericulata]